MVTKYEDIILEMLQNAPNPNETLPISNRKETIYGLTLPFLIVTWFAVFFRLWVRFRIVREAGWDDFFVVVSAAMNTLATAVVLISVDYGLGRHFLYLGPAVNEKYLKLFYIENATYVTETAFIKISLLLQYMRIFQAGKMRLICIALLVLISFWGLAYSILAWFPCSPIRGYWHRQINPKCWGYGMSDKESFVATFTSHAASNMVFDFVVFVTPMVLFAEPRLKRKSVLGMAGVFVFGSVVVFTSVWRLYTIVNNRAATAPYVDYTWWAPVSIVLSCLEIDLAIICASMPIFWPVIESKLSQIFVTHEVRITEHRRIDEYGLQHELEHRPASLKSGSGSAHSEAELTRKETRNHYKDQYIVAHVDPLASQKIAGVGIAVETEVESQPKPKWRI